MNKLILFTTLAISLNTEALERSAIHQNTASTQNLKNSALTAMVEALGERVSKIIYCNNQGKVYAPNNTNADTNGCINNTPAPTGSMIWFTGTSCPSGYIEANGQSTNTHPELATIIGSNVPDLRGEFVRGLDKGRGIDNGRTILSTQTDKIKSHQHVLTATQDGYDQYIYGRDSEKHLGFHYPLAREGYPQLTKAFGGTETRPRNIALLPCIKY